MEEKRVFNPHDAFFKEVFSRREMARDFLKHYLPEEVAALLDLDTLTVARGSFVDEALRQHYSDVLYRVRLRDGNEGYVAVLFEHKSYADRWVALQVLRYMVRIWEQQRKQDVALTPVIPVVVYHGVTRWSVPQDFGSLIAGLDEALRPYFPDYRYHLCDLSEYSDEEIVGTAHLQMALLLMKYALSGELWERLPEILRLFEEVWRGERPTALMYFEAVLRYVSGVTGDIEGEELREVIKEAFSEGGEAMETILERWERQGFQKGMQQGMQQGLQQGMQQGLQQGTQRGIRQGLLEAIELGLNLRFGVVGLGILPQVRKIEDVDRLRAIKQALLSAENVDELAVLLEPTY